MSLYNEKGITFLKEIIGKGFLSILITLIYSRLVGIVSTGPPTMAGFSIISLMLMQVSWEC